MNTQDLQDYLFNFLENGREYMVQTRYTEADPWTFVVAMHNLDHRFFMTLEQAKKEAKEWVFSRSHSRVVRVCRYLNCGEIVIKEVLNSYKGNFNV